MPMPMIPQKPMFKFSKPMEYHKIKTAEEYFADWIGWFHKRGIKTELRRDGKGVSLWRQGVEFTEKNNPKKEEKKHG